MYKFDPTLRKKFFRFETMWMSYPDFPNIINNAWANTNSLPHEINTFEHMATEWAKFNFGNIFKQIEIMLTRLQGIQNSENYFDSLFLQTLEQLLISDFNTILKIEENFWKLKSRINWLKKGTQTPNSSIQPPSLDVIKIVLLVPYLKTTLRLMSKRPL